MSVRSWRESVLVGMCACLTEKQTITWRKMAASFVKRRNMPKSCDDVYPLNKKKKKK